MKSVFKAIVISNTKIILLTFDLIDDAQGTLLNTLMAKMGRKSKKEGMYVHV